MREEVIFCRDTAFPAMCASNAHMGGKCHDHVHISHVQIGSHPGTCIEKHIELF
jgi:hypothetical protein